MNTMSDQKISDVEVFVHKKIVVSFACPNCGLEKSVNVERIKDVSHWKINATCRRCAHKFKVSFNFRKYYRKETSLRGLLYSSFETLESFAEVNVTDLSLTGIGFACDRCVLKEGSVMVVRFLLDDERNSAVEKEIMIQSVRGDKIGAVFVGTEGFDVILGKYILPK